MQDRATTELSPDACVLGYRLYTVVPRLLRVIDNVTNWYIRFNRRRLKGSANLGVEDTVAALNTLFHVLFTIVRALAPFTPFITEHIYGLLKTHLSNVMSEFKDMRSVHFLPFPSVQEALFDDVIERQVSMMQRVIQLGRVARERRNISLRIPLLTLVVIGDEHHLSDVEFLKSYVQEELNVRDVILTSDEEQYNILLEARVDWPTLGKKLKKEVQIVRKALPGLTQAQLRQYQKEKKAIVGGIQLEGSDLTLMRVLGSATANPSHQHGPQWEPAFEDDLIVLLDVEPYSELVDEGLAREIINRIQRLRKKTGLIPTDDIHMQYSVVSNPDCVEIDKLVSGNQDLFETALRGRLEQTRSQVADEMLITEEEQVVGNLTFKLQLVKI